MKKPYGLYAILCCLIFTQMHAQVIPDSLRSDWSQAGYQGFIPDPALIINVKDFGAYGDSVHDDYAAIINAINSSAALRVIYFPAGDYLIKTQINPPDNIVFRGEGVSSNLIFNLPTSGGKDAFNISSIQTNIFTGIDSGYKKGSSVLYVTSTTGLTTNSYAEIRETNGAWNTVPATWATYCVGQIVKIKAINGNQVSIEPALRIDYNSDLLPEIRPVTLRNNIGFECLKITRADTITNGRYGYNINFSYALNCWVTGVESSKSQASHILLESAKNISISGCYFHDAFTYDGTSTAGYGVTMIQHNSDCKVENCIFKHLRHPMVAKHGANGNIFAYNYSLDPYRSEDPHDAGGDMVLHGHYPFANLFEGNIGETMIVDDTWGASGPYNTFFRNRMDLYGIIIFDQTVNTIKQNIVGNEVTNIDSIKGNYYLQPAVHFTYDNNIKNTIQPPGTGNLTDSSYYLKAKPYFWNVNSPWPSVGGSNVLGAGTNPAKERYLSGESKTTCIKEQPVALHINISADSINCNGGISHIAITAAGGSKPYTGTGEFYKSSGSYSFIVTDAYGYSDTAKLTLNEPLPITATANVAVTQTCKVTGSITLVNIAGGHATYSFSLNGINYVPNPAFINLPAGSYMAYIKDNSGCIDTIQNIIVASVPTIKVSASKTKASSCKNDGSITVKRSGGVPPFQYSINKIDYVNTNIFTNLASGSYTAWVKDKTGCVDSFNNIIVSRVAALKATVQKANVSCKNASDGKITIKASGGTAFYLYSLDSINYSSNNTFTNLSVGTYKAWVKDASGCTAFITAVINNSKTACSYLNVFTNTELKVSIVPIPSTQSFVLTINSNRKEKIFIVVTDAFGRVVYQSDGTTGESYMFGEDFIPGVYVLKLMRDNTFKTYKIIKQ